MSSETNDFNSGRGESSLTQQIGNEVIQEDEQLLKSDISQLSDKQVDEMDRTVCRSTQNDENHDETRYSPPSIPAGLREAEEVEGIQQQSNQLPQTNDENDENDDHLSEEEFILEFARLCAEKPGHHPLITDIQEQLPHPLQQQFPMLLVNHLFLLEYVGSSN